MRALETSLFFLFLLILLPVTVVFAEADQLCINSCDAKYGPQSPSYDQKNIDYHLVDECNSLDKGAAYKNYLSCAKEADSAHSACMEDCKVYLTEPCYGECESNYNQCISECGRTREESLKTCTNIFLDSCHALCIDNCTVLRPCTVKLSSDFEGVAADGVSSIIFTATVEGDYEEINWSLKPRSGRLNGFWSNPSQTSLVFTPFEDNGSGSYLPSQEIRVWAECINSKGERQLAFPKDFSIVQPPIFFVHGILSSAETWNFYETWAKIDGFEYEDISYPSTEDLRDSAALVKSKIHTFVEGINAGKYYLGKKINAAKVDVVVHSQGGVITRYYTTSSYEGNIRKFVMLGTPNNGSYITRNIVSPAVGIAGKQLRPGSDFLTQLNSKPLEPSIDYYTMAGIGWYSLEPIISPEEGARHANFLSDGVVALDSVQLPGVPLYCTYDAHSSLLPDIVGTKEATKNGGTSLTGNKKTYNLVKDILLGNPPGNAFADCFAKFGKIIKGEVKSPARLHVYDENGHHVGVNEKGEIENELGEDAYYSNASGHESITIYGDRKVKFIIAGESDGRFGFDLLKINENGTVAAKSFENVTVDAKTQYSLDPLSPTPELVKEEKKSLGQMKSTTTCPLGFIFFGALLISTIVLRKSS
jgi:pimeloyl-ACP methyl ester carboxylesterase